LIHVNGRRGRAGRDRPAGSAITMGRTAVEIGREAG